MMVKGQKRQSSRGGGREYIMQWRYGARSGEKQEAQGKGEPLAVRCQGVECIMSCGGHEEEATGGCKTTMGCHRKLAALCPLDR